MAQHNAAQSPLWMMLSFPFNQTNGKMKMQSGRLGPCSATAVPKMNTTKTKTLWSKTKQNKTQDMIKHWHRISNSSMANKHKICCKFKCSNTFRMHILQWPNSIEVQMSLHMDGGNNPTGQADTSKTGNLVFFSYFFYLYQYFPKTFTVIILIL